MNRSKMGNKRVQIQRIGLLLIVSLLPAIALAQSSKSEEPVLYLTIQDAIDRAKMENLQVEIAEQDIEIAKGALRQTHAVFLPQVSIEESGVVTNDPLQVFGYRLKQESVTSADFDPGRLNDPGRYENFSTRLEIRQPLINTNQLFERRSVNHNLRAAHEALQGTRSHIRFQVRSTYYGFQLATKQRSVVLKSLEAARENDRQAEEMFDQEILNRADRMAVKVRLLERESMLSEVNHRLQEYQDQLRYLLDVKNEVEVVARDSLQRVNNQERWVSEQMPLQNATLRAMEHSISAANESLKSSRWSALPNLNLFGSYEFNDEIPFGTRGNNYMVGATLRWNLFEGGARSGKTMGAKARVQQAKLLLERERVEQRLELDQARRFIEQAERDLAVAEAGIEQAKEDYRIRRDRFREGLEPTTDLLSSEARLLQAKFRQMEAVYQFNLAHATLEMLLEPESK